MMQDEYLYHYTSIETLLLYILPQKRLRFSSIKQTNDPEERYDTSLFNFSHLLPEGRLLSDEIIASLEELSHSLKEEACIISLSQDDSSRGYEKPRMWAQYSNHHRGACLVLRKQQLLESFRETYQHVIHHDGPINYDVTKERQRRTKDAYMLSLSDLSPMNLKQTINRKIDDYLDVFYFNKHPDWKQENEYRLLVRAKPYECFVDLDGILDYIIIGTEAELSLKKPIDMVTTEFYHRPTVLKLSYDHHRYYLKDPEHECEVTI